MNGGLAYLLLFAWRAFLDSQDLVAGVGVHPASRPSPASWSRPRGGRPRRARPDGRAEPIPSSRIFKAQTGVSITRFRNQRRLERFLALYGDGRRITALAASLEAGFGSYAQFHRVLRAETGQTPTTLRAAAQLTGRGER